MASSNRKWAQHKSAYSAYLNKHNFTSAYQLHPHNFLELYNITGFPRDEKQMANFLTNYLLKHYGTRKQALIGTQTQKAWVEDMVKKAIHAGEGSVSQEEKESDENHEDEMQIGSEEGLHDSQGGHHGSGRDLDNDDGDAPLSANLLRARQERLDALQETLDKEDARLTKREDQLEVRIAENRLREEQLDALAEALDARAVDLSDREGTVDSQEVEISDRRANFKDSERDFRLEKQRWEEHMETREKLLDEAEEKLSKREDDFTKQSRALTEDKQRLGKDKMEMVVNKLAMDKLKANLNRAEEKLGQREKELANTKTMLREKDEDEEKQKAELGKVKAELSKAKADDMAKSLDSLLPSTFLPAVLQAWTSRLHNLSPDQISQAEKLRFRETCKDICGQVELGGEQFFDELGTCWEKGQLVPALRKMKHLVDGVWEVAAYKLGGQGSGAL
ncbi:hypothetical protein HII31_02723 [Pseudocercospora fuligena]|uniref:Uncharacterized protein n=1 Tax=Pseudocercospora fuligena TaxID=685502 RepID=A0A8H6RP77_9PEZI|nr:hypothetical protein HII31_02723 [Pseudocercospora fuligena]